MKKLMSVIVVGFAGMAFANAQVDQITVKEIVAQEIAAPEIVAQEIVAQEVVAQDSIKRTLVDPSDLPTAVQETLRGDAYMGWVIVTAYYVEPENQDAYYEISLQREGEEELRIVLMNADGTVRQPAE